MKPQPHPHLPSDWATHHPWLYIYIVVSADLLLLLALSFLIAFLKGALP